MDPLDFHEMSPRWSLLLGKIKSIDADDGYAIIGFDGLYNKKVYEKNFINLNLSVERPIWAATT